MRTAKSFVGMDIISKSLNRPMILIGGLVENFLFYDSNRWNVIWYL